MDPELKQVLWDALFDGKNTVTLDLSKFEHIVDYIDDNFKVLEELENELTESRCLYDDLESERDVWNNFLHNNPDVKEKFYNYKKLNEYLVNLKD